LLPNTTSTKIDYKLKILPSTHKFENFNSDIITRKKVFYAFPRLMLFPEVKETVVVSCQRKNFDFFGIFCKINNQKCKR